MWLVLAGAAPWAPGGPGARAAQSTGAPASDLQRAINRHAYGEILELIRTPAALRTTDAQGNTPLHRAVAIGDALLVELLLAYGADPDVANAQGHTPVRLMHAWSRRSRSLLERRRRVTDAFVQHHLHADEPVARRRAQVRFFAAVSMGDPELARDAVRDGADPNATRTNLAQTVMHQCRQAQMVPELLSMGVDLERADVRGDTPLRVALAERRVRMVEALLDAGARIDVSDDRSDLASAAGARDAAATALARLLLAAGAPVRHLEWMAAMRSRNERTVRLLLRYAGPIDPETAQWEERVAEAVRMGGEPVMAALRGEPSLAAYLDRRQERLAAARERTLDAAGSWLTPHLLTLGALTVVFAGLSSLAATALTRRRLSCLVLAGVGAAVMTHLFVFTDTIEGGLADFRLLGEPVPGLRYVLYVLFAGASMATGVIVGLAAWHGLARPVRRWAIVAPGGGLFVVVLGVLVAHNSGMVAWPTAGYRWLTGYDAYVAHKERENATRRAAAGKREIEARADDPAAVLFDAIRRNDAAGVRRALAGGAGVNARNRAGETPLFHAMSPSRPDLVPLLIDAGADVDAVHARGRRPIHALLESGLGPATGALLEMLLDAGADIDAATSSGYTPLCLAARSHRSPHYRAIRALLLERGATLAFSDPCAAAMYAREPDILTRIVATRAHLDARRPFPELTDPFGPYDASALWQAAYALDVERARLLLALGADVESRDTKRGMTPLQAAVDRSRHAAAKGRPMVALLLASGADPEATAWDGTRLDEMDDNGLVHALLDDAAADRR